LDREGAGCCCFNGEEIEQVEVEVEELDLFWGLGVWMALSAFFPGDG
jgi:hypothetical protein